jgi:hypothetical protein
VCRSNIQDARFLKVKAIRNVMKEGGKHATQKCSKEGLKVSVVLLLTTLFKNDPVTE